MPKFSAFTPFGHLAFSKRRPVGQTLYEAMRRSDGEDNWDSDFDSVRSATVYARAMCIATAQLTLERAGNNANPRKATELLPVLEFEYGVVPGRNATLQERRALLAAERSASRGKTKGAVLTALQDALGSDFVEHRILTASEIVDWPSSATSGPGAFKKSTTPRKLIQLTPGISTGLGGAFTVAYTLYGGTTDHPLPGETLVIDAGKLGIEELVTIELVDRDAQTISATITKAHAAGAICTTAPHPFWASTARHHLVVVASAAKAADPEVRRKVHRVMRRVARGVSTWAVVAETSPGSGVVGPFKVGEGLINITPISTALAI